MKTKRIIAETMPLALKKVRQELGGNAIIVNTRAVKAGGFLGLFAKQKFEVTAYSAEEEPYGEIEKPAEQQPFTKLTQNGYGSKVVTGGKFGDMTAIKQSHSVEGKPNLYVAPKPPQKESDVLVEIKAMRKMMMAMMSEKGGSSLPAPVARLADRLKEQGVTADAAEYVIGSLLEKFGSFESLEEREVKKEALAILTRIIEEKLLKDYQVDESIRIINVVGPTGVGKTTTIAKLATEQVLRQKRKVAMITTDVYRIGAVEQLKTYAGILNVPIEVVHSAEEVAPAVEKLKPYDLIYMDTTGRNYKEARHLDDIGEYLESAEASDHYLVLSLTSKYEDMKAILDQFAGTKVKKIIFTKMDETSSYGSIVNIARDYPYSLAYVTTGQSVPEDIMKLDAALLAESILGVGQQWTRHNG